MKTPVIGVGHVCKVGQSGKGDNAVNVGLLIIETGDTPHSNRPEVRVAFHITCSSFLDNRGWLDVLGIFIHGMSPLGFGRPTG